MFPLPASGQAHPTFELVIGAHGDIEVNDIQLQNGLPRSLVYPRYSLYPGRHHRPGFRKFSQNSICDAVWTSGWLLKKRFHFTREVGCHHGLSIMSVKRFHPFRDEEIGGGDKK